MKNRILKALASFGLSVCVLAGSSVVSIAEETPGKTGAERKSGRAERTVIP